jgi:hypothetical protein
MTTRQTTDEDRARRICILYERERERRSLLALWEKRSRKPGDGQISLVRSLIVIGLSLSLSVLRIVKKRRKKKKEETREDTGSNQTSQKGRVTCIRDAGLTAGWHKRASDGVSFGLATACCNSDDDNSLSLSQ